MPSPIRPKPLKISKHDQDLIDVWVETGQTKESILSIIRFRTSGYHKTHNWPMDTSVVEALELFRNSVIEECAIHLKEVLSPRIRNRIIQSVKELKKF